MRVTASIALTTAASAQSTSDIQQAQVVQQNASSINMGNANCGCTGSAARGKGIFNTAASTTLIVNTINVWPANTTLKQATEAGNIHSN